MAAMQGQCATMNLKSKAFLGDACFAGARRSTVQQRGSLQVPFSQHWHTLGPVESTFCKCWPVSGKAGAAVKQQRHMLQATALAL